MNLYAEFHPLAVEMLDEFGTDAMLTATAPAAPTVAAKRAGRAAPAATPLNTPVRAVVTPLEVRGDNGRLETRSVATMLVEPKAGDTLTMGPQVWKVDAVTRVAPQGAAILFFAEVS